MEAGKQCRRKLIEPDGGALTDAAMVENKALEQYIDYGETVFRGSADQFIASGRLRPEQIPGDPACPKVSAFRFEREGRLLTVTKGRRTGLIKLRYGLTDEENEDRCARRDAEHEYDAVERREEKERESLPVCREHYIERLRIFVGAFLATSDNTRESLLKSHGGYSVRARALNKYIEAVEAAFRDLCAEGNIIFNRAARNAFIEESKQRVARADPDFQSFLVCAGATQTSPRPPISPPPGPPRDASAAPDDDEDRDDDDWPAT